jgi:hypothetical protein
MNMRFLTMTVAALAMMSFVSQGFAASHAKKEMNDKGMVENAVDKSVETVKENPGVSTGVAACGVAIAFFPPALLVCGGAIAAGAGVDQVSKDK